MKQIAIFGATGMLGKPVVQQFVEEGFLVKALVRDTKKAKAYLPTSVQFVEGDLQSKKAIQETLEGVEGVYLSLSIAQSSRERGFQPEREGLDNVLEAAQTSSVKVIGYISSLVQRYQGMDGFDWWAFRLKNKAIEKLKSASVPSLIFYPSTFMENYDKGSYRQGSNIALVGTSKYPMYFIAGKDYARQVVTAFKKFEGTSKEYWVQGLEGFKAEEAAKIYVDNYQSEKLRVVKLPLSVLKFMGSFTPTFYYGAKIMEALNRYPEAFESEKAWEELGKPTITLNEYAKGKR